MRIRESSIHAVSGRGDNSQCMCSSTERRQKGPTSGRNTRRRDRDRHSGRSIQCLQEIATTDEMPFSSSCAVTVCDRSDRLAGFLRGGCANLTERPSSPLSRWLAGEVRASSCSWVAFAWQTDHRVTLSTNNDTDTQVDGYRAQHNVTYSVHLDAEQ